MQNLQNVEEQNDQKPVVEEEFEETKKTKKGKKKQASKPPAQPIIEFNVSEYEEFKSRLSELASIYLEAGQENINDSPDPQNDDDEQEIEDLDIELEELDPIEKLSKQLEHRSLQIDTLNSELESLKQIHKGEISKQSMLQELVDQYDPIITELIEKNIVGSTKIETLYGKVKKSREKIDQVLEDTRQYQKEFEAILVMKKSKPLKLKISKQIMESKLDSYKNYLMSLQAVTEDLERQVREYKKKEKEVERLAKIQGVRGNQKHNTQTEILKKKIEVLEAQIKQKKEGPPPKKAVKGKNKSKSIATSRKKPGLVQSSAGGNLLKEIEKAKNDIRDRDEQIKILNDMIISSTREAQMKGKFIDSFIILI